MNAPDAPPPPFKRLVMGCPWCAQPDEGSVTRDTCSAAPLAWQCPSCEFMVPLFTMPWSESYQHHFDQARALLRSAADASHPEQRLPERALSQLTLAEYALEQWLCHVTFELTGSGEAF